MTGFSEQFPQTNSKETEPESVVPEALKAVYGEKDVPGTSVAMYKSFEKQETRDRYIEHLKENVEAERERNTEEAVEATPKEWREKLRNVVEGSRSVLNKEFLRERSKVLGERLKQFGLDVVGDFQVAGKTIAHAAMHPFETVHSVKESATAARYAEYFADRNTSIGKKLKKELLTITEGYNKLAFRHKAYITASLILASAATSAASLPTASALFAKSMFAQRALAGAGFGLNRRKGMEKKIEENPEHWLADKTDTFKNTYAGALGLAYAGTSALAGHYAAEGLTHWLGDLFHGTGANQLPPIPETSPGIMSAADLAPQHLDIASHLTTHVDAVMPHVEMQMPVVHAAPGHGYEYMLKRLAQQLQEKHITLAANADHNSDLYQLLHATHKDIDGVVHRIASDPRHGFFHSGESVQIDPSAHITVGADGQVHFSDAAHTNIVHAAEGMKTTPAPHVPEAPVAHAEPTPAAEHAVAQEPHELPTVHLESTANQPAMTTINTPPSVYDTGTPAHTEVPAAAHGHELAADHATQAAAQPSADHLTQPPTAPLEHTKEFMNSHDVLINPTQGHIFQDTNGAVLAYGNNFNARLEIAEEYVKAHHNAEVWVQAEKPVFYKGAWHPWVFSVRHGGFLRGVTIDLPAGPPDPSHIGAIAPNTFVKQLDK